MKVRPFRMEDRAAVIGMWHGGWHDAHAGIVPAAILPFRTRPHFETWFEDMADRLLVAVSEGVPVGFVGTSGSELTRLYVCAPARGTGAARTLLIRAEDALAGSGARDVVLHCIAGNARAERFYAREGWTLDATFRGRLWRPADDVAAIAVDTRRFRKHLA